MKRIILALLVIGLLCTGCSISKEDDRKVSDLDFTVVAGKDIPEELRNVIEQKKQNPFKMTYDDQKNLYIIIGYGKQQTGGYSIAVKELYLSDNAIYIKTNLIGPKQEERRDKVASYPYVVVKMDYREEMVVFNS